MGVVNYEMEVATGIPQAPAKIFKAFVLNSDKLIPKILPQAIKNIILTPALDHDCSVNMGVTSFNQEFTTPVAPAKMFNGLFLDSQKPFPKLVPQSMKSIKFAEGDGGAGCIKQTNFPEA